MRNMPMDDRLPFSFFDDLLPTRDVALRPEAEAAMSRHDALQRLVEHGPDAVFGLDHRLRCYLANREARRWCQPDLKHDLGADPTPLHTMVPEPLMDVLVPYLSAALRGTGLTLNASAQHPELGWRTLFIQIQPDHAHQTVVGVFLHIQDTTERAQENAPEPNGSPVAAKPMRSEPDHQLRLLAEGLRDAAIFFLDARGRISDWTPSAQRLLGHAAKDMTGQSLERLLPEFTPPQERSYRPGDAISVALERAALLGQSEAPGWQVRADGSTFWAHTLLTALHDGASGQTLGYACLMRDMTENKRLLDMLQELNAELELRVEKRTRQLSDINRDLEAFSSSISHDLRAPLRHISSFVQLLREDLDGQSTPGVQRQLDTIAQAAEHMGQMIEGLLAFSQLGRASLRRRSLNMADLLHSSLNRVQHDPSLRRPAGEVHWELPATLPTVEGDGLLLSQVWDNLLANALKYSRPSQPAVIRVNYRLEQSELGAPQWVFWVQDNGVGFNPQRAERLFNMFQRLHRASEFEGTGIGLALCRRIVERHDGSIWAESTPQEGSSFYFSLPAPADGTTKTN